MEKKAIRKTDSLETDELSNEVQLDKNSAVSLVGTLSPSFSSAIILQTSGAERSTRGDASSLLEVFDVNCVAAEKLTTEELEDSCCTLFSMLAF